MQTDAPISPAALAAPERTANERDALQPLAELPRSRPAQTADTRYAAQRFDVDL